MENNIITIVITGAASSGKTSIMRELSCQLKSQDILVYTLQETATELLESGFSSRINKKLFQSSLFDFQLSRECIYREYISSFINKTAVLLIDRSLLDGAVYISDEDFHDIISKYGMTRQSILARYDAVIQLQSSVLVEDYQQTKNNEYRQEISAEECIAQDRMLKELYHNHSNYEYIKAEADFETKLANAAFTVQEIIKAHT